MAQVILIHQNKTVFDLLNLHLANTLGLEVIPRMNAADAIALLNILPSIETIICSTNMGKEKTDIELLDYLIENNKEIPLFTMGENNLNLEQVRNRKEYIANIEKEENWEKMIELVAQVLKISPAKLLAKIVPDFIPIPIRYFYHLDKTCCDIFIRIKKSPTEFQFIKRIHAMDVFSKEIILKYESQGLQNFYISKEDEKTSTNFMSNRLVEVLEQLKLKEPPIDDDKVVDVLGNSYEMALTEVKKLGFNSITIQLTDSIIENFIKTQVKTNSASPLFRKIVNSPHSFLYRKAHLITIIAIDTFNAYLENLEKNNLPKYAEFNDLENSKLALSYAAFFHDLAIAQTEKEEQISKIHTWEMFEKSNLNDEDWDLVFNHALEASILLSKHPEIPIGTIEIVKEHHGQKNGKGFVLLPQKEIGLLSKIFYIAQEFTYELLLFKEKSHDKPVPIISILKERFASDEILELILLLEQYLKKKK